MRIEVENEKIRERKKKEYSDLVEEMDKKGYEARLEKISVLGANIFGLAVMLFVGSVSFFFFILIQGDSAFDADHLFGLPGISGMIIFMAVFAASIFVHEFIHGFFWHFYCKKKWESIDFGFNPKNVTPYCHCREPLKVVPYFWGSIAPTLMIGILPIILGILLNVIFLVTFGIIGVVGGSGDLMVIFTLRKHKNSMLFDHPYEVGYAYFVKKND